MMGDSAAAPRLRLPAGPGDNAAMLHVTPAIIIPEEEIREQFIRAGGPGGQHVNKTASAVQLRFNVEASPSLPEDARRRLLRIAANRIGADGDLVIRAQEHRSQDRNRQAAREQLAQWIRRALEKPKPRRPTRPSNAAKRRRLEGKRLRGTLKKRRKPVDPGGD